MGNNLKGKVKIHVINGGIKLFKNLISLVIKIENNPEQPPIFSISKLLILQKYFILDFE